MAKSLSFRRGKIPTGQMPGRDRERPTAADKCMLLPVSNVLYNFLFFGLAGSNNYISLLIRRYQAS